jgi:hypothetical protein
MTEVSWEAGVESGREQAEAILARIGDSPGEPEGEPDPGPRIGSPEWEAQQAAAGLLKQDAARETLRQKQPQTVSYDAEADDRRSAALARVRMLAPATRWPSAGGERLLLPNRQLVMVERGENGIIKRWKPAVIGERLIRPDEWDEFDAEWKAARRREDNHLLARTYGTEQCVAAGLFSAEEAAGLDPQRSRQVTLPPGVEAV